VERNALLRVKLPAVAHAAITTKDQSAWRSARTVLATRRTHGQNEKLWMSRYPDVSSSRHGMW